MDLVRENSYQTQLQNSTLLPLLLLSLMKDRNSPRVSSNIRKEYDYIIVGAGAAGSVLAHRLSEMPCVNILLLEAGPKPPVLTDVPSLSRNFWYTDIDWAYKTVPQKYSGRGLVNRKIIVPRGKALGGSTILNGMLFIRGNRKDYDDWAAMGAKGWSYKDVFPYFLKMEDNRDPEYLANGYHNDAGPLTVHRKRYVAEFREPIFEAANLLGYRFNDPNGRRQTGFYDDQATLRNSQRCSTAKAYLVPVENRTNLDILPNAFVTKIKIQKRRATGVLFDYKGRKYFVKAKKEVLLSAGAVNTPQLLMLSGIGPKKELRKFNIPVVVDLPVGKNLQDHCGAISGFQLRPDIPNFDEKITDPSNILMYIQNRTGVLAVPEGVSLTAFLNGATPTPRDDFPNTQIFFLESRAAAAKNQTGMTERVYQQVFGPYINSSIMLCMSQNLRPRSRGTITIQSANPYDPPLIDSNFFSDARDLDDVVQGLKICQEVLTSPPLRSVVRPFETLYPGCEKYAKNQERYFQCQARSVTLTIYHQSGTAKMGHPKDPTTVVDPKLRVKGIKGLRVVDASIMPNVISGNTNAPTIMIGEKASDIIKSTISCQRNQSSSPSRCNLDLPS